jgi:hypothetical protein
MKAAETAHPGVLLHGVRNYAIAMTRVLSANVDNDRCQNATGVVEQIRGGVALIRGGDRILRQ